jgi:hypothetical protein
MNKAIAFLAGAIAILSCTQSSVSSENSTSSDSLEVTSSDDYLEADFDPTLYGEMDSTFTIGDKVFKVNVKHFDRSELATSKGDTLSRPTYTCTVKIVDASGKTVLSDSVLRDSFGYEGKIQSIDSYEMYLPDQLFYRNNEIIIPFLVSGQDDDVIEGCMAFDIRMLTSRYYWQEPTFIE